MYQTTDDPNVIQRSSDGAFIPVNYYNTDYQAYVAWVKAGNTGLSGIPIIDTEPRE